MYGGSSVLHDAELLIKIPHTGYFYDRVLAMELSIFLAKVFGLYSVIVCAAVFFKRRELEAVLQEFEKSRLFAFFSGAMALLLGLAIVVGHAVWEFDWRILITVLGWLTVIKGVIRLFFFDWAKGAARKILYSGWYWYSIGLFFSIGLWLTYIGFRATL